jgi:hypothetical protein
MRHLVRVEGGHFAAFGPESPVAIKLSGSAWRPNPRLIAARLRRYAPDAARDDRRGPGRGGAASRRLPGGRKAWPPGKGRPRFALSPYQLRRR